MPRREEGVVQTEFKLSTRRKYEVVDVTERVAALVAESGVEEGICTVFVPHATAAVVINENDDLKICDDLLDALNKLIPEGIWRHDRVDNNGAAHIKAAILGPSETVPVRSGRLLLGTWQAIMVVDLDGPRSRTVVVTVR
jgi:secondary thiamine-phosphate synthase enzyme